MYWNGPIQILDAVTGLKTNSTRTPVSAHTGTDTDFGGGLIYISGYWDAATSFQVYNVAANTLTTLANQPSVPNHSTITVMR